jgi:16S rRNA (guanine1516-N2)-methyltransferase
MQKPLSLAVTTDNQYKELSQNLAKRLALPLYNQTQHNETTDFILRYEASDDGSIPQLTLSATSGELGGAVTIDFCGGKAGHRRQFGGGRGQPLAKAIGLKGGANPTVIDTTAGMGKDAFVLACLGAQVTLIERSPILATLLENGLERASRNPELTTIITDRMNLVTADAIEWLTSLATNQYPDVIYMDPMYPHRNKSALVKKEMRVLRELVGDDEDASQLLHTALSCAKRRVTVKRPSTAPILSGSILNNRKPNSTVESKNTRYDIYVPCNASEK